MTTTRRRPRLDLFELSMRAVRAALPEHANTLEPLEESRIEEAWTVATRARSHPGKYAAPMRLATVVEDGDRLAVHMHDVSLPIGARNSIRSRRFRTGRAAARAALAFVTDLPAGAVEG